MVTGSALAPRIWVVLFFPLGPKGPNNQVLGFRIVVNFFERLKDSSYVG